MSEVVDMEQTIANLTLNQQGLLTENKQLREALVASKEEKKGPQIYGKMLAVKKDIGSVGKDQKNMGQGWAFRGIDQFINALHPILNKHGVGILPSVIQHAEPKFITNDKNKTSKNTHVTMKYTFFAEDGSTVDVVVPAEGVDPGDKGTNKALSAALKYALIQTFCVPTQDMAEGDKDNVTIDDGDLNKSSGAAKRTVTASTTASTEKKKFKKRVVAADTAMSGEL